MKEETMEFDQELDTRGLMCPLPILKLSGRARARAVASSRFVMNAPLPTFTSSTIACAPAAIFLLITLLAIRGMLKAPKAAIKVSTEPARMAGIINGMT